MFDLIYVCIFNSAGKKHHVHYNKKLSLLILDQLTVVHWYIHKQKLVCDSKMQDYFSSWFLEKDLFSSMEIFERYRPPAFLWDMHLNRIEELSLVLTAVQLLTFVFGSGHTS